MEIIYVWNIKDIIGLVILGVVLLIFLGAYILDRIDGRKF